MNEEYLTVSELNHLVKDVINAGFPQSLWICGEIQGYDRNRGKNHIFFELVEKDPDSKSIIAKIGLVLFSGRKAYVQSILRNSENAFELKDDIEVKFACKIDFYPPHGAFRLIVEDIDPVYTLGKLAQEKQKLIALLKKKGILDKNKQTFLTEVPLNIGLITSGDSAAHNDFQSELQKSGFGFKVYLRNTLMQGKKTEGDVCKALDELARIKQLDVIVITRGGGSIADLSFFDSQKIAEKIAASPLPVLSGIGHEINTTITDLVAHSYAKTPTAVARLLVNSIEVFLIDLNGKMDRIIEGVWSRLEGYSKDVNEKMNRIVDGYLKRVEEEKQRLKNSAYALQSGTMRYLKDHNAGIIHMAEVIKNRPMTLLKNSEKTLILQSDHLKKTVKRRLSDDKVKLGNFKKIIDIAHPLNTMRRGFSITRTANGRVLKSISDVSSEEQITTECMDGLVYSNVTEEVIHDGS
jgi:exodeoxyribonuclease VII large subunit